MLIRCKRALAADRLRVRWGSDRASNQARWGSEALLRAFLSWELFSSRSFPLLKGCVNGTPRIIPRIGRRISSIPSVLSFSPFRGKVSLVVAGTYYRHLIFARPCGMIAWASGIVSLILFSFSSDVSSLLVDSTRSSTVGFDDAAMSRHSGFFAPVRGPAGVHVVSPVGDVFGISASPFAIALATTFSILSSPSSLPFSRVNLSSSLRSAAVR